MLVSSREAGLCRTDIEVMTGIFTDPRWVHFPVIPGHEWSGTVVEVGANVESVRAGDRVVCEGLIGCNRCTPCRRGETHWCERIEALGFTRPGGYAELVTVPARVVHRLPDHVSFDAGVLIEPASVVLHGLEKAQPQPGETVGVIGIGTLGSLAIALLRLHSPARLVAYGIREAELELGMQLGASEVVSTGAATPAARRARPRRGHLGRPVRDALATEICRPGGRALLLGIAGEGRSLTLRRGDGEVHEGRLDGRHRRREAGPQAHRPEPGGDLRGTSVLLVRRLVHRHDHDGWGHSRGGAAETVRFRTNDLGSVRALFDEHPGQIAAVDARAGTHRGAGAGVPAGSEDALSGSGARC